jgi:CheY-like chemotaxis protein
MHQTLTRDSGTLHFENRPSPIDQTPDLKGKTLMIVEDVPSNYQLLNAYLGKSGARIIHVDNGIDAVDLIKSKNVIDLIIMDIRLPKLNGLLAAKEIRKMSRNIPIIAQTAFAMQSDREMCLSAGCNEFLAKPFRKHELMQMIAKFI